MSSTAISAISGIVSESGLLHAIGGGGGGGQCELTELQGESVSNRGASELVAEFSSLAAVLPARPLTISNATNRNDANRTRVSRLMSCTYTFSTIVIFTVMKVNINLDDSNDIIQNVERVKWRNWMIRSLSRRCLRILNHIF